ncbi:hypothetical protein AX17_007117 [Amanita inopinata Kibby_2008]|nr:hypothetical protein AX17_007117 [Amanita inopinata Kibby_2008]
MEFKRQLATLYAWCTLNNLEIDSRLELRWNPNTGIGVYSIGLDIPLDATLVRIPSHAVLSTQNCTLSEYIPSSMYGLDAQLSLALALYIEILKDKSSRWFGYLQSFDKNVVDIPLFWQCEIGVGEPSKSRTDDGLEALQWLRGTEAEKILRDPTENLRTLVEELDHYYDDVVEPFILEHRDQITKEFAVISTLHGFYRAYSLVSSRAFIVDAYHGLSMVPIADAFNHELQNHVHLESDYHVCPECGSLRECSHDRETSSAMPGVESITSTLRAAVLEDGQKQEQEQEYHMVANAPISPGVEVFNTYGERLTSAQLLTQYGFVLEANENDVLTWQMEEIFDCVCSHLDKGVVTQRSGRILSCWTKFCRLDWNHVPKSTAIYLEGSEAKKGRALSLNADGKVSHQLWILMALFSFGQALDGGHVPDRLHSLLSTQLALESHLEETEELSEGPEGDLVDGHSFDNGLLKDLEQICHLMICVCKDRKSKTGKAEFTPTVLDLGEMFDALPEDRPRTRLAISVVLNEMSLLNSCEATWTELHPIILRYVTNANG